jgi:hypothetical protein
MNIKEKLIEQLGALENLQLLATQSKQFDTAERISRTIMDYIRCIDMTEDGDNDDNDYTCPNCQKAEHKAMLRQDIANACDLPIELVNRVLAGRDAVLGMDD